MRATGQGCLVDIGVLLLYFVGMWTLVIAWALIKWAWQRLTTPSSAPTLVVIPCPHCNATLHIPAHYAGVSGTCNHCGQRIEAIGR